MFTMAHRVFMIILSSLFLEYNPVWTKTLGISTAINYLASMTDVKRIESVATVGMASSRAINLDTME
jgi:hypothetical protein